MKPGPIDRRRRRRISCSAILPKGFCITSLARSLSTLPSMAEPDGNDVQGGLSEGEKRDNVIRLAFGGNAAEFDRFCGLLEEFVPPGTVAILRGSAITGTRWKDGAPFDADGPGTSDLDVTFVGDGCIHYFNVTGF